MPEQYNDYHPNILRVHTKLPVTDPHASPADVYHRQFSDPQSAFRAYNTEMWEAADQTALLNTFFNIHSDGTLLVQPSLEDLNGLGSAIYNLWLNVTVEDSQGNPLELDSSEFIAWQRDGATMPPDVWAQNNGIEFVINSERLTVGDQQLNIEWHEGMRNVRGGYRSIVTEPRQGYYGEFELLDSQGAQIYNSDGQPDIFLTEDVYNQMREGQPYRGPIVVQDLYESSGEFDEIKFFAGVSTADEARAIDASTFANRSDYDARDVNNQYTTISSGQLDVWKYSISENPDLMKESFVDWATSNWGSLERFNGIFGGMQEVSRDQYRTIVGIANGADGVRGTADDLSANDVQAQIIANAENTRQSASVQR